MEEHEGLERGNGITAGEDGVLPVLEHNDNEKAPMTCVHTCREAYSSFTYKLKHKKSFKTKVIYTICIYAVYFIMGWQLAQIGPALQEVQIICGVGLERGSWIFTASSMGYVVGALNGGSWLYKKMDRKLFFGLLHAFLGFTYLVIPWCSKFWAMVCMYAFQGTLQGAVEPGLYVRSTAKVIYGREKLRKKEKPVGYTEILSTWKTNGRMILLGLNCVYCVGGILSPLATAPFLMEIGDFGVNATPPSYGNATPPSYGNTTPPSYGNTSDNYTSHPITNVLDLQTYHYSNNFTSRKSSQQSNESNLYIAFLITSCFCFVVAMSFFLTCSCCKRNPTEKKDEVETAANLTRLPCFVHYTLLVLMGSMFCIGAGIVDVFLLYLSTFCTKHFSWDTTKSSLIMSVAYISSTLSTIFGVILVKFQGPLVLSGVSIALGFLSFVGFAASSIMYWQEGIWLFASLHSFATMNFTSLLFTWTNEYIAPVSGHMSSFFVLSNMIGNSLHPLLVGYIMEEMGTLWFCYLFVIECGAVIAIYVTALIITKYWRQRHVRHDNFEMTVVDLVNRD